MSVSNLKTTAENFKVLDIHEFLPDALLEAKKAKKRIITQAMFIEPGKVSLRLLEIYKIAGSVLDKKLYLDWFGLMTFEGNPVYLKYLYPSGRTRERIEEAQKKKDQLLSELKKAGVSVIFTNPPSIIERIFPYMGRDHRKVMIIDDIVYVGGINFSDRDLNYVDFVVKLKNRKIASILVALLKQKKFKRDKAISVDKKTKIIIDSGISGKSLILATVISLIKQSKKSILHTCQFVPDGEFLKSLHSAFRRGVISKVIIPQRNEFSKIMAFLYLMNKILMDIKRQRVELLVYPGMVHAKLTLIDGKYVFFGSHNLSKRGITVGTNEIAILSSNKKLVSNLLSFYNRLAEKTTFKTSA